MSNVPLDDALKTFAGEMLPALEQEMRTVLGEPATSLGSVQALSPRRGEGPPDRFYGMMHYHMGWLDTELQPASVAGNGKRIRPLLCLLSCQAAAAQGAGERGSGGAGENLSPLPPCPPAPLLAPSAASGQAWQQALPAAAAIELLHNFSLIHDDIEDASPSRRGRDTLWKIWGVAQAINSGDAMFALSHLALNGLVDGGVDAAVVVHALRRFDETCVRLTQGQHADMDFESRDEVSVAEYMEMITGKTAVLLSLCAELGALIGGASGAVVEHYAAFGRDLGLAFQVKDDILGIWGDEARIGKSAATDIATRKKTLPVLYALSRSPALRRLYRQPFLLRTQRPRVRTSPPLGKLRACTERSDVAGSATDAASATEDAGWQGDNGFVQQALPLLDESGARDFAGATAARYSQSALDHLEAAEAAGAAGAALYQLAHLLLNRDF